MIATGITSNAQAQDISASTQSISTQTKNLHYPTAPTSDTCDDYFGIHVADPYRPLEDDMATKTLDWVEAERALTENYLQAIPYREAIRSRLTELMNYRRAGMPAKHNGYYYFAENDGLQNQSVIYRVKTLGDEPEVFLDPNKLSENGTVALKSMSHSNDGRYTAYVVSANGSDWEEIYVLDTATGEQLPDHLEWVKFTSPQWLGNGFFYSAYDRPSDGHDLSAANEYHRVYFHRLGTPQADDELIYEDRNNPLYFHHIGTSDDENVLILSASGQGLGNSVMIRPLGEDWRMVEPTQNYEIDVVDVIGDKVLIYTNADAKNYRLVIAPLNAPQRENWQTLVAETENVLAGVQLSGDKMLLTYNVDARDKVLIYTLEGELLQELELPSVGSCALSASRKHNEVFYSFTSFTYPAAIYRYDIDSNTSTLYRSAEIANFNADNYTTEQVFYPSADGTLIPMFITYKKGVKRDGTNPTYLYGYGGFNISLSPGFSAQRLLWLERGGIYAQANLRGGGEYGEAWHVAGTKQQKMNVFNDFIAAAEYLIAEGYTSADKLVIAGGSNGGLLVGATTNLRPDLFRVAVPAVGVMDMMRYHLFTIGWNWASDYGTSADDEAMARYLLSYSPLHNIKNDGTRYPAVLITTADHDDRVVPAHSFKYAATLQAADTGDAPKLIRIESNAGHGAGKPISKYIDEYADVYTFIFSNLGIDY